MKHPVITKTPSHLKWLLVERATLLGDVERLEERKAVLNAKIGKIMAKVAALDATIHLFEARIETGKAGVIRRHAEDYGQRRAIPAGKDEQLPTNLVSYLCTQSPLQLSQRLNLFPFENV